MLSQKNYQGLLVFEKNDKVQFFWRSTNASLPSIFSVESSNGKNFKKHASLVTLFRSDGAKTTLGLDPLLRASHLGTKTILFFVDNKKQGTLVSVGRGESWNILSTSDLFRRPTVFVKLPAKGQRKSKIVAFFARNRKSIIEAHTTDLAKPFHEDGEVLEGRRKAFDATTLEPLSAKLIPQGILLVYTARNTSGRLVVGAAIFDRDTPKKLLWQSDQALWELPAQASKNTLVLGGADIGKYFFVYTQAPGKPVEYFPLARYWETFTKDRPNKIILPVRKKGVPIHLERFESNPVLEPITKHSWEAFATFNPAALFLDGRVHLLYRAQGYDGLSVLGYASSTDGIRIDERLDRPAFISSRPFDTISTTQGNATQYISGGGTSGCEDPRLVEIDGSVYLIYIAFDGINPPGVALSYISKKNFLAKRFKWSQPTLISRPKQIQKNWVLFPEKINGKFVVLHGLSPKIRIEYINDPKKLGHGKYIESLSSHGGGGYIEAKRLDAWDNIVRGVGAPPLKTKYGWLVFYHGMDMRDPGKYKVGAMLLDLQHPEEILCRAVEPVLEPETEYENNGHKRGVVYVCGAVIKEKELLVYYGAADRTSAVASANLETFLQDLLKNKAPTLEKMNVTRKS